jgi:hypothetical protein
MPLNALFSARSRFMLQIWSSAGCHVGGEDVVGMAVEVLTGPTWWTRLLKTETSAVRHDLPFGALLVTCPVAASAAPLSQFR